MATEMEELKKEIQFLRDEVMKLRGMLEARPVPTYWPIYTQPSPVWTIPPVYTNTPEITWTSGTIFVGEKN